jgi:predicted amidohydrolase YtcJ
MAAYIIFIIFSGTSAMAGSVYYGGDIITMAGDQPEYVDAVAVDAGKIVAIGSREAVVKALAGPATLIDLKGQTLMPGFIDAHSHLMLTASKLSTVNMDPPPAGDVRSIEDIVSKLSAELAANPRSKGQWLTGWGFDNGMLSDERIPTRADLDRVSTEVPIVLMHFSAHMVVLNSAGLARVGYDRDYVPPPGGTIGRDKSGEPNGIIEETAMFQLFKTLTADVLGPEADLALGIPLLDAEYLKLLKEAQEIYLSKGFTTISDFATTPGDMALLSQLRDEGELKADVVAHMHNSFADLEQIRGWYSKDYNRHLRVGGAKINLDGGTPGRTAFLREPYYTPSPGLAADYRGYSSIPDQGELNSLVASYYQHQVPIFIHALGDAAVDQAITAVRYAEGKYPYDDIRTQLIHLQVVADDQFAALEKLDVCLTFQNTHNYYFADFHNSITLGPERTRKLNAMRTAMDRGFSTTFHHDSPVHPVDSLMLVWIAVNRESRSGAVYGPEERLTVYQALRAATIEGAWQFHEEERKGSLEVGKFADMVVLDSNPLKTKPSDLADIQVVQTIKEGVVIYASKNASGGIN